MESIVEKIPNERIGVLIGTKAQTKKLIEEQTNTTITINQNENTVKITSGSDAYNAYRASQIVKAIAIGFSAENAQQLFKDNRYLIIVNLRDYFDDPKDLKRVKARIIGLEGKARKQLERETRSLLTVYDNYVGLISPEEYVDVAEKALEMLINGAMHKTVYNFVSKQMKQRDYEQKETIL